jgi:sugar lactone lactonase YvrE
MTPMLAPDLPESLQWLNVAAPARTVWQRDRLTLLAFVNAGSTWSQQRLHELQVLCARHPQQLRALAVHVPRFDHERNPRRVQQLLNRHGIGLPVALDADWVAWQHYGIGELPSVVVIDGAGRVQATLAGDAALEAQLDGFHGDAGLASDDAGMVAHRRNREPELPLRFPVGLAVTPQYLYVADSGHHRVLECSHAGRILRQFGTGDPDGVDGPMALAGFRRPHGLCLMRDTLYVADTGNHAVRRIDLRSGDVGTLCGNGRPGAPQPGLVLDPRAVALDSPRALAAVQDQLFIALAGDNRIWSYDLGRGQLLCCAGSGELALRDGHGSAAAFAQPVALAAVQQTLYVCDAAGSAIRALHLRDHAVQTLVGQGLWEFGLADGARASARLQDPQAIALDPDAPLLWIADTGNDRLRSLRLGGGEVASYSLSQPLHGPAGLAIAAGAIWIADTDAHAVLRLDPDTGAVRHVPIGE